MRNLLAAAALVLTVHASAEGLGSSYSTLESQVAAQRQMMMKRSHDSLAAMAAAAPAAAPGFVLPTPSGQSYGLADFAGRVVVLEFWANWSGPAMSGCQARTALAGKWNGSGVSMLDIGVGETPSGAQAFAAASAPADNETILLDADKAVFASYGGQALPLAVVIDRNGAVVASIPGADTARVDAAIRTALAR